MKKFKIIGNTSFGRFNVGDSVFIIDIDNGRAEITDGNITDLIPVCFLREE